MKTPVMLSRGSFFGLMAASVLVSAGCATLAGSLNPAANADRIARENHFVKEKISTRPFTLTAYSKIEHPGLPLTVYIEGDGRAWLSKFRLAEDPTPMRPMVLELASLDPSGNVVYLARPCQYGLDEHCQSAYWSDKRFSEEVIDSMDQAVTALAKKAGTDQVHLVGYSGGAAVAALVAARRSDVITLRTIAGNLDPATVNQAHGVGALNGSLDPMTTAKKLSRIPQRHFIGGRDTVIPPLVAQNFVSASGAGDCTRIMPVAEATHHDGWIQHWKELVLLPAAC